ncbi:MAG: uracil-DNA glycosylase [Acidimicrobiales bacterium]
MSPDQRQSRDRELMALAERVSLCEACPRLVAWRNEAALHPPKAFATDHYWARPLAGFGDPQARLVVVGLAPAAHGGNRTGRMFTGDRSGDFLVAGLYRHGFANQATSVHAQDGLELIDAYVTAPVRCAPPDNRPLPQERDRCMAFLEQELSLLPRARVYLALGAYAFAAIGRLTRVRGRMRGSFGHGVEVRLDPAVDRAPPDVVVCTYHPSQRNVFTGLLTAEMFSAVLARARVLVSEH